MKFPIEIDSPEDKFAQALANDLCIEGISGGLALPLAIKLMALIDAAHDDPMIGVEKIIKDRKNSDEWWVRYHPKTKHAREAKKRLKLNENLSLRK